MVTSLHTTYWAGLLKGAIPYLIWITDKKKYPNLESSRQSGICQDIHPPQDLLVSSFLLGNITTYALNLFNLHSKITFTWIPSNSLILFLYI